jgi:hypothetical protein
MGMKTSMISDVPTAMHVRKKPSVWPGETPQLRILLLFKMIATMKPIKVR